MKTVTEIRQCSTRDTFIEECLSCTEFFFGLEARGEIETAKCAVKENAEAFYRVGERDCGIIKLNGVDRNRGQFLSCSHEHRFCLFTV